MFTDEVKLNLESGKGGDGAVSFRREKYIPKGGPDGGDGGMGGNVYVVADAQLSDLNHLASIRHLKAENGIQGSGRKLYGRAGEDLTVRLPVGTRVYRQFGETLKQIADLVDPGVPRLVLKGGKGGRGNVHFATATNQTPREAEPGEPGERAVFKFELQLIADVGIIGKPNAGKSTFLAAVTEARPKIGAYPFTTLSPVLGVVQRHEQSFIFADIPGLIEGAAEGKGLGHDFLRHSQRTKMLVHFIESLSPDYVSDYQAIRRELSAFDPALTKKPEIVVITKSELITDPIREEFEEKVAALKKVVQSPSQLFDKVSVSAVTKENLDSFLGAVIQVLNTTKQLDNAGQNS